MDGGRPVREGGALSGADYGPEEALCAAGDLFGQMVSAVALLDDGGRAEDEKLMGRFAERSIGDISTAELIILSEAKARLTCSPAAAAARRKIGLFDSVDAEMGSDDLMKEPETRKPTESLPGKSLVDQLMETLTNTLADRLHPDKLRKLIEPQAERKVARGGSAHWQQGNEDFEVRVPDEKEDDEGAEEPALSAASRSVKGRLMAGIMSGGMASLKGSKYYKTLEERQMEDRIDRLHRELVRNKALYPRNEFEVQLNYAMEEYCGLEVRLVRLETVVFIGGLSDVEVRTLKAREEGIHNDIVALRRKRDVL